MSEQEMQRPSSGEIDRAIAEASGLRKENERLKKKASSLKRLAVGLALALVVSVAYGVNGYLNPSLGVTDEMATRWAQAAVFDLVGDIEAYRDLNGALPSSLADLGFQPPLDTGLEYTAGSNGSFTVTVQSVAGPVTYRSGDDLTPFAAAAGSRGAPARMPGAEAPGDENPPASSPGGP